MLAIGKTVIFDPDLHMAASAWHLNLAKFLHSGKWKEARLILEAPASEVCVSLEPSPF
jgi:hypothetical protein